MQDTNETAWVHRGFEDFARGQFEDGGSNLYVNANGIIEKINRTDCNNDGYVDIVLPNTHGYIERAPTWIYTPSNADGKNWVRRELANDSGWMSRIVDVDGDGYLDLVVVNAENGVTSELDSYVYWGGPDGLTGERTELPTVGAYDVATIDINGDGRLDLIFPSAWVDHHVPGRPKLVTVYVQTAPRQFTDRSEQYGLTGIAATSVACGDLTGNGRTDLVVANYRNEFEYDTDSFVYWGTEDGFDAKNPLRLPTHYALQVLAADLSGDGTKDLIFCGGDQVQIYWNDAGKFSPNHQTIIHEIGFKTMFCVGSVNADIADVDADGKNELILATEKGIQVRHMDNLQEVDTYLPLEYSSWVHVADLNGDGRPEIIASKYDNHVTYETDSVIFWNGPDGFSADRITSIPTAGAMGCTAGDLDGNGKPVVIFNNTMQGPSQDYQDFPIYVYLGGKEADYGPHRRLELPSAGGSYGYVMADFDLDGYADLAFSTPQGARVFPGGPQGFKPDHYIDLSTGDKGHPIRVLVADFNRDGYLDLLVTVITYDDKPDSMANSCIIFFGSADGFSNERSMVVPTLCDGAGFLADLNRDGYVDFITDDRRGDLLIFLGGPDGFSSDRIEKISYDADLVASFNVADLTGNGYLDLIVACECHYTRGDTSFYVLFGGPDGYDLKNSICYRGGYSPSSIVVADIDNDGKLELLVSAYSTAVTRELSLQIFKTDNGTVDLDHPINIHANSAVDFVPLDLTGNGYLDLITSCHRNDLGHQVDSMILLNGPEGISPNRIIPIPGMGPHLMTSRDPGNPYNRDWTDSYFSPPFHLNGRRPTHLHWKATTPQTTHLKFQLRFANTKKQLENKEWKGPDNGESYYEHSGQSITPITPAAQWLQYRAVFYAYNDCLSPQLIETRINLSDET